MIFGMIKILLIKTFLSLVCIPILSFIYERKYNFTEEEIILKEKAMRLFNIDIDKEQIAFRRFKKSELKPSSHDKTRVTFEQEYPEDEETCFLASGQRVVDQ